MRREVAAGDRVRHFKNKEYTILCIAYHTETEENLWYTEQSMGIIKYTQDHTICLCLK